MDDVREGSRSTSNRHARAFPGPWTTRGGVGKRPHHRRCVEGGRTREHRDNIGDGRIPDLPFSRHPWRREPHEILAPGTLHVVQRPSKRLRRAAETIRDQLGAEAQVGGRSSWLFELEPEVRFEGRVLDPDLAGWRMASVPGERPFAVRPDWVCELVSPTTAITDVRVKLPAYAACGIPFIWFVDPELRLLQVFVPEKGQPMLVATASEEDIILLPPFDVDLSPVRWWQPW